MSRSRPAGRRPPRCGCNAGGSAGRRRVQPGRPTNETGPVYGREGPALHLKTHADTGQEIVAKLPSLTRRDSVEVEYAGMRLARLAHVDVPDFWIERTDTLDIGGIEQLCPSDYFLAVARFDRVAGQSPVHIEDWCQV